MYIFSSFNKLISAEQGCRLYNSITKKSIGYSNFIESLSVKFFHQQLEKLEINFNDKLLQIIVAELLSRGIIIPIEKQYNELDYLNSITPLQLPTVGFMNCKTIDVDLIDYNNEKESAITLFGVPCDLGAARPGSRYGPKLLRLKSHSINFRGRDAVILDIQKFRDIKIRNLLDLGDINLTTSNINNWILKVNNFVSALPIGVIPLMLGGDHTFTLPVIEALWKTRSPFILLQLDHHLDIQIWGPFKDNKPENLDLLSHNNFISWLKHAIPQINILQVGVCRYQSIGNKKYLDQVTNYLNWIGKKITDFEIQNNKIDYILSKLPQKENVYLSIDVDVISSFYIGKHTGFPGPTGIDLEKFSQIIDFISSHNKIIGIDIMEYGISDKVEYHNNSSTIIVNTILNILQNIN